MSRAWGRIAWMRHYKVSGGTDIAKLAYAYSPASDRLYQQDLVTTTNSELYAYDSLHRLTNFKRGTLNANKDGITGTPSREQTWTLDHVGNWQKPCGLAIDSNDNGDDGSPSDARTHNTANRVRPPSSLRVAFADGSESAGAVQPDLRGLCRRHTEGWCSITSVGLRSSSENGKSRAEIRLIRLKRTSTREARVS